VENEVRVTAIGPGPAAGLIRVETTHGVRLARRVVLATGFDGGGTIRLPDVVTAALPADRYDHACRKIDFARLRGKRVGVLGHGASAFDASVVALDAGAASVDLCFRRAALPTVNPHRHLEGAGLMANWPYLDDSVRWNIARQMRLVDQPPAHGSFFAALARRPGFAMHAASPWQVVALDGEAIRVETPGRVFMFDHLICATGFRLDLAARPELAALAPRIALWRDRYQPPAREENAELGMYPYLSDGYELQPLASADDWIGRIHAFNFAAVVSCGPHSTSISGQKYALPRLVRSLVRHLFLEQQAHVISDLRAYAEQDLIIPVLEDSHA
jgi:cation diffusion facilitator CzcD-associated flavoprotein CzcO